MPPDRSNAIATVDTGYDHGRVHRMADTSHQTPLVELPYGTRQRIVVVPDDVLQAQNDPSLASDEDRPRRPWDARRGDPRHPTLKALKEAEDDGLHLLPVS